MLLLFHGCYCFFYSGNGSDSSGDSVDDCDSDDSNSGVFSC